MWLIRLLPAWMWGLAAAIGLAMLGWRWHQADAQRLEAALREARSEVATLQRASDQWRATAEQRRVDLQRVREEWQQAQQVVQALQADLGEQHDRYQQLQQRIAKAPATEDGPVAAVLEQAIEALP